MRLVIAGAYLYYWARLNFGDTATVADDPIVSFAIRFSGHIRTFIARTRSSSPMSQPASLSTRWSTATSCNSRRSELAV